MAVDATVKFEPPDEIVARMQTVIDAGIEAAAQVITDAAVRNIPRRPGGRGAGGGIASMPGQSPTHQTGNLSQHIFYHMSRESGEALVGTDQEYGRHLEFGANPKGNLTVPLTKEAAKFRNTHAKSSIKGVPFKGGRQLKLIKTPKGVFLVDNIGGKRARTVFHFILKKSVRIAPRPWLRKALIENQERAISMATRAAKSKFRQEFGGET